MTGLTSKQLTFLRETPKDWTPYVVEQKPGTKPFATLNSLVRKGFLEKMQEEEGWLICKTEAGVASSRTKKLLDPNSLSKICPTCLIEKDKEMGFGKNRSTRDGYQSCCLECGRKATASWKISSDSLAKRRATKTAWRKANPESARESVRKCWDKNYDKYKVTGWRHWIKTKYGLTEDQYYELLEKQNYGCAICGAREADSVREKFCVDHCHDTGLVRGLLCFNCNTMIGNAQDSVEILQNAIDYLKKFPKTTPPVVESEHKEEINDTTPA